MASSQSSDALRRAFPRGAVVPLIDRRTSRSGMQRVFDVLDPKTYRSLAEPVADLLGLRIDYQHGGVVVTGVGMDMAGWLEMALSRALHGDDDALTYKLV